MICPYCGKQLKPDTKFCDSCGNQIVQSAPIQVDSAQSLASKGVRKKNLPLIITAVILVIAVIISGCVVGFDIFKNNREKDGALYIDDFPVLKQQTEFTVYDSEKFPAEEYKIKVERMLMGGILKSEAFRGETVIEDTSTEPVYNIDFKKDGDYRITLTDITAQRTQTTSATTQKQDSEIIHLVIIIDVKVDNDAEDAVDRVDIHSHENPAVKRLEATQEDWTFMTELFSELQFYRNDYDCTSPDANYRAVGDITFLTLQIYDICAEQYGFPEKEFCETDSMGVDPLTRYNDKQRYEGYVRFDAEAVDWIAENIYNVQPLADEGLNEDTGTYAWYRYEGYYYSAWLATGEEWYPETTLINQKQMPDGKYEVDVVTHFIQYDEISEEYNYKIITALNEVEGKRVWTFYEWREAKSEEETSSVTQPTNPVTESEPKDTYEKNARMYNDYLVNGGFETLLEEAYMQDAKIKIETCLLDINDDGVYELLLKFTDTEHIGLKGYITNDFLFGIQNGQVIRLAWESYGGGSAGGSHLYVRYDTVDKKHCVYFENIMYDGVWAVIAERAELEYKGNHVGNNKLYETKSYLLNSQYDTYDEEIERIKNGTDLYMISDDNSRIYAYYCNGKNISETEHDKNTMDRYVTPTDEKYLMKEGTYKNPLGI